MKCQYCEKELPENAKFCSKCGNAVEFQKGKRDKKSGIGNLFAILLIVGVLILVPIGVTMASREQSTVVNAYDSLSAEGQAVVDLIVDNRSRWESDQWDSLSINTFKCSGFGGSVTENGVFVFWASYMVSKEKINDSITSYTGFTKTYSCDVNNHTFEITDREYQYIMWGRKWNSAWSDEEARNEIADLYAKAIGG